MVFGAFKDSESLALNQDLPGDHGPQERNCSNEENCF